MGCATILDSPVRSKPSRGLRLRNIVIILQSVLVPSALSHPLQLTCLGRNPENVVHWVVVAFFDHRRLQRDRLSDGSSGLSQVEEVN